VCRRTEPDLTEWGEITADYPRNVCDLHPLCVCPLEEAPNEQLLLCEECAVPPSEMCAAHSDPREPAPAPAGLGLKYTGACHGITTKRKPCKQQCREEGQLYCKAHQHQAKPPASVDKTPLLLPKRIDPKLEMQTALRAKLSEHRDALQRDEEAVSLYSYQYDLLHCVRAGCRVSAVLPVVRDQDRDKDQGSKVWWCPLHVTVPLPLAFDNDGVEEPEALAVDHELQQREIASKKEDVPAAEKGKNTHSTQKTTREKSLVDVHFLLFLKAHLCPRERRQLPQSLTTRTTISWIWTEEAAQAPTLLARVSLTLTRWT
jgi:hypothetical protein